MDITTLPAWGEFLGGIAVVASLIYLASQIRQNSRLLRASTTAASSQVEVAVNTLIAEQPDVAGSFVEGLVDRESFSADHRRRFDAVAGMWFQVLRQQYQFQLDGIGSADEWTYRHREMRWMFLQGTGTRQWWRKREDPFPDAFREVIDALVREAEAAG
jgi:hypothetical protein